MSSQPWRMPPTNSKPQHQIQVQVDLKQDILVCPCGGLGLIFNAAFLPKFTGVVGEHPQVVGAPVVICNVCGQRLTEPFIRAGDVKEAS